MLLSMILIGLFNLPVIFLFKNLFNLSNWWGLLYYLLIGLFGLGFHMSMSIIKDLFHVWKINNVNIEELKNIKSEFVELLEKTVPKEFL